MSSSSSSSSSPPPLTNLAGGGGTTYIPQIPNRTSSSSSFGKLSPSILIIILILGITIIASVSLCLLLRHLNRRCLRHLSTTTASSDPQPSSTAVSSRRVSPENPAETIIDSLPVFAFSAVKRPSSAADCAVCLSKFEAEDQLRLLPLCCHAFHAVCVDTWLRSSQTCPLCRSSVVPSIADELLLKTLAVSSSSSSSAARIEIGSVSRRRSLDGAQPPDRGSARRYSIGSSFDYLVDDVEFSEVEFSAAHRRIGSEFKDDPPSPAMAMDPGLAAEVGSGRSWLKEYVDRLSVSFRSSGRFFTGSSRRSDVALGLDREWDLEANRVGEEITELFRWFSGV